MHIWSRDTVDNSKRRSYAEYKAILELDWYLDVTQLGKYKHALAMLRRGCSNLKVVVGRQTM